MVPKAPVPARIMIVDVTASGMHEVAELSDTGGGALAEPTWSPDGRYLAMTVARGQAIYFRLQSIDSGARDQVRWNPPKNLGRPEHNHPWATQEGARWSARTSNLNRRNPPQSNPALRTRTPRMCGRSGLAARESR